MKKYKLTQTILEFILIWKIKLIGKIKILDHFHVQFNLFQIK